MAKLKTYVSVDGVTYGPDSVVPDEVASRISNPKVWDGEPPAFAGSGVRRFPMLGSPVGAAQSGPAAGGVPPRSGKGSGADAWAAYAAANGVPVAPDATRDDVIAALDAAGIPTE